MNELTIFKNDRFGEIPQINQYAVLGILSTVLSEAMRCTEKCKAWETMRDVSLVGHQLDSKEFNDLYEAAAEFITDKFQKPEFYYHALFNKLASNIIPGCTVISRKSDCHNFPDSWVEIHGKAIPVEIKLHNFGESASRQLERYMNAYKSDFGIAVGATLTANIPGNVLFIPLSELDLCEKLGAKYLAGRAQLHFINKFLGQ